MDFLRIRLLQKKLDAALLKRDRILARATKITVQMSDEARGKGLTTDMVGNGAIELMMSDEAITDIKRELGELRRELAPWLRIVRNTEARQMMEERYLQGLSARYISIMHSCSERHVYKTLETYESLLTQASAGCPLTRSDSPTGGFSA